MLRSGDVFAGFSVEHLLGQGGMGSVYLARHPRLQRQTALKLLNRELFADAEVRARFEREADLVAQLDHPNIVAVYDRGVEDQQLWISMQYVDGVDAASVNPLTLPPERAVQIIEGVAAALDYAHRNGVLHRDVKPANMLLGRDTGGKGERVYLTDFGIARLQEDSTHLTQAGMFTATLAYASPEQMTGAPLDERSDQYALGCALYWLLCGTGPFDSEDPNELIHGHMQLPLPPVGMWRAGLNPALDPVLARAMAKRAIDRFATCADFAAAAKQALTVPIPAVPLPLPAAGLPPNSQTMNPVSPVPNPASPVANSVSPMPVPHPQPTGFPPDHVLLRRVPRRSPNTLILSVLAVVALLVVVVAGVFVLSGGSRHTVAAPRSAPPTRSAGQTGSPQSTQSGGTGYLVAPHTADPVAEIRHAFPTLLPQGVAESGGAYSGRVDCARSAAGQPGKVLQPATFRRSDPLGAASWLGAWECTSRERPFGYAVVVFDSSASAQAALAAVPPNQTIAGTKDQIAYTASDWTESDDPRTQTAEMVVSFTADPNRATAVLYAYNNGAADDAGTPSAQDVLEKWWEHTPL
ncbi:serine/threonine-protein kinase [Nocardia alni]|uniref:serine/threonine-protein kinase n=1 Tax=Nocardia alni TaxID=2815723 RepID=UPI001C23F940|nr:serine/threonine-protein kinase [Nocardia alni]